MMSFRAARRMDWHEHVTDMLARLILLAKHQYAGVGFEPGDMPTRALAKKLEQTRDECKEPRSCSGLHPVDVGDALEQKRKSLLILSWHPLGGAHELTSLCGEAH